MADSGHQDNKHTVSAEVNRSYERMQQLIKQLFPENPSPYLPSLETRSTSVGEHREETIRTNSLREVLLNNNHVRANQELVYEAMRQHPQLFIHDSNDLSRDKQLDLTFRRMMYLCREKSLFNCQELFSDFEAHSAKLSAVMHFDESLYLKIALTFNFFAGSLYHLAKRGKRSFHGSLDEETFWNRINNLEIIGCFAITELSHGSNVASIETVAVLDAESKQFVIHTPRKQSMKWWIGNAAHAHMSITFAQLYIAGVCYGIHAFVVPLRHIDTGEILPGVTIGDCGPKIGYNMADNGYIMFNQVRIPLDHLLDRFASVSVDKKSQAKYTSPISNSAKRFGSMLAQLTMGRCSLVAVCAHTYAMGLRAAIPYAFQRTQFPAVNETKEEKSKKDKIEPNNEQAIKQNMQKNDQYEIPIISYQEQKLKLYPLLAEAYAFQFASKFVMNLYIETMRVVPKDSSAMKSGKKQEDNNKVSTENKDAVKEAIPSEKKRQHLHVISASFKAYCSEQTMKALSILREACGGHGYASWNRFGDWRNVIDVTRTFEGDNTVLYQQVAKHLMHEYQSKYNSNFLVKGLSYTTDQLSEYFKGIQLAQYSGNIRDKWYYMSLLEFRSRRLIHTAVLRYQAMLRKLNNNNGKHLSKEQSHDKNDIQNINAFLAWNYVQHHLIRAAKAHVESILVDCFLRGIERFQESYPNETNTFDLLYHLCTLYALNLIQSDFGWFLSHCMNDAQVKQIQKHVTELCEELTQKQVYHLLVPISPPDDIIDIPISMKLDKMDTTHVKREDKPIDGWTKDYMQQTYERSLRFQKFGNVLFDH